MHLLTFQCGSSVSVTALFVTYGKNDILNLKRCLFLALKCLNFKVMYEIMQEKYFILLYSMHMGFALSMYLDPSRFIVGP